MDTTWPLGDTGVDVTIPLANADKSAFVWPVGYLSATAYLTRDSDNATFSAGVLAATSAAIITGVALSAAPGAGTYRIEIVIVLANGESVIIPTAGGLRFTIRDKETVRP